MHMSEWPGWLFGPHADAPLCTSILSISVSYPTGSQGSIQMLIHVCLCVCLPPRASHERSVQMFRFLCEDQMP